MDRDMAENRKTVLNVAGNATMKTIEPGRRGGNERQSRLLVAGMLLALVGSAPAGQAWARKSWPNSPLSDAQQIQLEKAGRSMKSGKFAKAAPVILQTLESCTDVPKCLAVASYTEAYAFPMMDVRRQCCNRALTLASTREDLLLVALKARAYQFFEITRQACVNLLQTGRTVPDLYDLASKAQEVGMNDIAHQAMEKAYTGIKTEKDAFTYAEQCKLYGMDDLLRKVVKDMMDDEDDVGALCDLALKIEPFGMRDQIRYCLKKAMDNCNSIEAMEYIAEASRRLNEPDFQKRAVYFVKKGKLIQKIKTDRAAYQAQLKAWKEGIDLATQRDGLLNEQTKMEDAAGFGSSGIKRGSGGNNSLPTSGF